LRELAVCGILAEKDESAMQHISSSQFKNQFGEFLASSRDEPITVEKSGRPVAVVLSPIEYEHLLRLEDLYWIARAEAAEVAGEWVGHDDAVRLLAGRLRQSE
jgi:prevent-host-death family protein